jgi:hypothetical protein
MSKFIKFIKKSEVIYAINHLVNNNNSSCNYWFKTKYSINELIPNYYKIDECLYIYVNVDINNYKMSKFSITTNINNFFQEDFNGFYKKDIGYIVDKFNKDLNYYIFD